MRRGLILCAVGFYLTGFANCQSAQNDTQTSAQTAASNNVVGLESTNNPTQALTETSGKNSIITRKDITINEPVVTAAKEMNALTASETRIGIGNDVITISPSNINEIGSIFKEMKNAITNIEKSSEGFAPNTNAAFIMPTNNVQLTENAGTIIPVESNVIDSSVSGQLTPTASNDKIIGSSKETTAANVITDLIAPSDQPLLGLPENSIATVSMTTVAGATQTSVMSDNVSSTTVGVRDSTQGTVAPTVTKVGKTTKDEGVILFKSDPVTNDKTAGQYMTTTTASTAVDTSVTRQTTAPQNNTTLNVMLPTSSSTTEFKPADTTVQSSTPPSKLVDTTTALVNNTQRSSTPSSKLVNTTTVIVNDAQLQVASQEVTVAYVPETTNTATTPIPDAGATSRPITGSSSTSTVNAATLSVTAAAKVTSQTETAQTEVSGIIIQSEQNITQSEQNIIKSEQTVITRQGSNNGTDNEVTCSTITCLRTCKHGRKLDLNGCETCECKFSDECPKPLPTPRLLCMMQLRLGQACSTDVDCPNHRICCPGSCGQSCRRVTSNRSRVLSILRILD